MVSQDRDWVYCLFQVMSPVFDSIYNSQQLASWRIIVPLSVIELSTPERNRMPLVLVS